MTKMTWRAKPLAVASAAAAFIVILVMVSVSSSGTRPEDRVDVDKKAGEREAGAAVAADADSSPVHSEIALLRSQIAALQSTVDELRQSKKDADEELRNIRLKVDAGAQSIVRVPQSLSSQKTYPQVGFKNYKERKRILVTGGAGFVGSHLVDYLMLEGHEVTVVDNFFTGRKRNVEHWLGHENFELINHDVVNPLYIEVDQIYHLASPASPPNYMYNPIKTIKTNTIGTINMLGLSRRVKARFLLASTSEVYGDPKEHPQHEGYWGHVNPIGPRACYDEAKRVAETMCYAYAKQESIEVRVARIFNTFGPRMHMNDGRVVSNFILQALQGEPITIYGDGSQTRSFQYVSDLVHGLVALMNSNFTLPVNLGNPEEHQVGEFASIIQKAANSSSLIVRKAAVEDDPQKRKPDISRAKKHIGWEPQVKMLDGISRTIEYFRAELGKTAASLQPVIFIR